MVHESSLKVASNEFWLLSLSVGSLGSEFGVNEAWAPPELVNNLNQV